MRPYRARFREQGVFFAFQSWAGCITNIFGFDLRQAQARFLLISLLAAAVEPEILPSESPSICLKGTDGEQFANFPSTT